MQADGRPVRVAAIVVTYERLQMLEQVLDAVCAQMRTPDATLVVDNSPHADARELLEIRFPGVQYLRTGENAGPGGGFAAGLEEAERTQSYDWYWLLDDDSPPARASLEEALAVADALPGPIGAVGLRGGHIRRGRIRHDLRVDTVSDPERADFLLVDGSIISSDAVRRVGRPRSDFFIMMEDIEFSLRINEAGFPLYVRPSDGSSNLYLGSGAPWRGYYQSRNHLRIALDRRSPAWLCGWLLRELAIDFHHLRGRRWRALSFRVRGAFDAARARMGRVVEP